MRTRIPSAPGRFSAFQVAESNTVLEAWSSTTGVPNNTPNNKAINMTGKEIARSTTRIITVSTHPPKPRTPDEMKEGIRRHMREKHARR